MDTLIVNLFLFLLTLVLQYLWRKHRYSNKTTSHEPPELPGAWPILGHLPLLAGRELPHKTLGAMADKHGPVFKIRIGTHRALVVSSSKIAKECFTGTNDKAFASRPTTISAKILGYNFVMFSFAPYGPYWRGMRKILISELLSARRFESFKHVWDSEINSSIKQLYIKSENHKAKIEMKKWFGDLSLNVILRLVTGKRYSGDEETEARRCHDTMRDFMRLLGVFMLEDAVPYLRWLDLQGYKKEMKKVKKELDSLFHGWLEEHQAKPKPEPESKEEDFIDVLITILEKEKISEYDNDTIIKAACLSIITGGNDTMMLTLTWILSLLLNNKQSLKKVQNELDVHVSRDRHVDESDLKNLTYLQAVIKEALRLYPAGPLSGPRVATEDCTVAGYTVPAGTRLIVNTWKIQRDPLMWSDPEEFRPERFMGVEIDVKGRDYELIPFGTGRRACPGIGFAVQLLPLIMGRLLHGFEISTEMERPVDMTETAGMTNVKATPLEVVITPRLRPELYVL